MNGMILFFRLPVILLLVASCSAGELFSQTDSPKEPDMASRRLRLSYVDPARCVEVLKLFGFEVGTTGVPIDRSKLPVVVLLPETKFHETIPSHDAVFPHTETAS